MCVSGPITKDHHGIIHKRLTAYYLCVWSDTV